MSLAELVGPSRTRTNTDEYHHAITLFDATKSKDDGEETQPISAESDNPLSRNATEVPLSRKWTKGTLREELTRRKYAKWQEKKSDNDRDTLEANDDGNDAPDDTRQEEPEALKKSLTSSSRLRDRIPFRSKKRAIKSKATDDEHVDILYENQRGWFFCGIPLYSGKSLLPIDPPSWQTGAFRDSPVNIINAQLPDPSWGWAWRRWYVDMSYDVDEEGWQYSFSFPKQYAWHGNHPWFHSFVRRRRWLRKRVKIRPTKTGRNVGNLGEAHLLNEDYFTIHAVRDRSRESSTDGTTNKRSSFLVTKSDSDSDSEQDSGDITNILNLMAILRRARVDREKMSAVKKFLDQGGEDLFYLADRMTSIMRVFVYRTSQQQFYTYLQQALDNIERVQRPEEGAGAEDEAVKQKLNNLAHAVEAAKTYLDKENITDIRNNFDSMTERSTFSTSEKTSEDSATVADEIKGIPEDAGISEAPGIQWDRRPSQESESNMANKGKEKA